MPKVPRTPEQQPSAADAPTAQGVDDLRASCSEAAREANDQATSSPVPGGKKEEDATKLSPLAAVLEALPRTDGVNIGKAGYEPSEEHDTGSWDELAQSIEGVKWLLPSWVPFGMLTGIVAEPKSGKSAFALWALIRPVVTGCDWFNNSHGPAEPGYAVFCDTERSAAVNIERMKKWGLPMKRIKLPFKDDPFKVIDIDDPEHIDRILNVVCKYKSPLVVVDSYRGAHKGDENNSKISAGLQNLGGLCEQTGAACVVIHHAKKMSVGEDMTINAGRGSNAFLAAVRCQIAIDIPDPKPNRKRAWRRVQVLGENLGTSPRPVGFRITNAGLKFGKAPKKPMMEEKPTKKEEATEWLRDKLASGEWMPSRLILDEADALGISRGAVQRAQRALGMKQPDSVKKERKEWLWRLPPPPSTEGKVSPSALISGDTLIP